jgi:hypothetical protein
VRGAQGVGQQQRVETGQGCWQTVGVRHKRIRAGDFLAEPKPMCVVSTCVLYPRTGLSNVRVVWSRAEDGARQQDLRDVSGAYIAYSSSRHWKTAPACLHLPSSHFTAHLLLLLLLMLLTAHRLMMWLLPGQWLSCVS